MNLAFGRQVCGDVDRGSEREWLVTDGLGGYAMGTVSGLRTRRYHGLLVVATDRPRGRRLALASLDPVLVIGDQRVRLATHEWRSGVLDPSGHVHRSEFRLVDGMPSWRGVIGPIAIEAELAMSHGRSAVALVHRCVMADRPVTIELEALCTWRDAHGETDASRDPSVAHDADGFVFADAYRVRGPQWIGAGEWYRDVHYRVEADRGLRADEDLWFAGRFRSTLGPGDEMSVTAWALDAGTDSRQPPPPAPTIIAEAHRRARRLVVASGVDDDIDAALVLAGDHFVVAGDTVVAGYPWFTDWSRDTLISYRGLFLETGRADEGRRVLQRLSTTLHDGLLANTSDTAERRDNAADAPLWFIHAARAHIDATGDADLAAELLPVVVSIVRAYGRGTRFGIGADDDGLVHLGQSGEALTWMDARVDGVPVTERAGRPVDVNALWISGLGSLAAMQRRLRIDDSITAALAARARRSFGEFASELGLADVLEQAPGIGRDDSRRPNQLLAASLPDAALDAYAAVGLLEACTPLVTSFGLRTLAPDDLRYRGLHRGDQTQRDLAYHQGTVWPWLVGAYADVVALVEPDSDGPRNRVLGVMLDDLAVHLGEFGLGSISETFDGDAPHRATGCPFQAWSVAEVLRARRLPTERRVAR